MYNMDVEKVKTIVSADALQDDLKISNALDLVKENAKIEDVAPAAEAEKPAEEKPKAKRTRKKNTEETEKPAEETPAE
jgi:ribosomal protein L12E/L44/L45/RPP1/RPP2